MIDEAKRLELEQMVNTYSTKVPGPKCLRKWRVFWMLVKVLFVATRYDRAIELKIFPAKTDVNDLVVSEVIDEGTR